MRLCCCRMNEPSNFKCSVKTVVNDIRVHTLDICWENSLWCPLVTYPSSERWGMLDFLGWSRRFTADIVCENVITPSHASTMIPGPKAWGHPVVGKKLQIWGLKPTFVSSWINRRGTFCYSNRKLPSTCKAQILSITMLGPTCKLKDWQARPEWV